MSVLFAVGFWVDSYVIKDDWSELAIVLSEEATLLPSVVVELSVWVMILGVDCSTDGEDKIVEEAEVYAVAITEDETLV